MLANTLDDSVRSSIVTVVAGSIDHAGSILIAQRTTGDRLVLTWEVPDGKGGS